MGDCREFRQLADILEMMDNDIAGVYADKSGNDDKSHWLSLMDRETWFSAEEAVAAGLADEVYEVKRKPKAQAELPKPVAMGPVYAVLAESSAKRIRLRLTK